MRGVREPMLTQVRVVVGRTAEVEIHAPDGAELTRAEERLVRRRYGDEIRAWLERECTRWDRGVEEILSLHQRDPRTAAPTPPSTPVRSRSPRRRYPDWSAPPSSIG